MPYVLIRRHTVTNSPSCSSHWSMKSLCLGVRPGSLQEVLQAEPPLCPGRQSRILLDADPLEPGTAVQRDVPVSFDPHHRQYGYRSVRELWQKVPDSPETTEHDPFREL